MSCYHGSMLADRPSQSPGPAPSSVTTQFLPLPVVARDTVELPTGNSTPAAPSPCPKGHSRSSSNGKSHLSQRCNPVFRLCAAATVWCCVITVIAGGFTMSSQPFPPSHWHLNLEEGIVSPFLPSSAPSPSENANDSSADLFSSPSSPSPPEEASDTSADLSPPPPPPSSSEDVMDAFPLMQTQPRLPYPHSTFQFWASIC
ncbi:hypothetical protein EDB19DRAFT_2035558 [Suillus lakei]|nr:hypothetical protein EDB19DRAFT_2035558 [Suillus lakei]